MRQSVTLEHAEKRLTIEAHPATEALEFTFRQDSHEPEYLYATPEQERDLYALLHRRIREREEGMREEGAPITRADMRHLIEDLVTFGSSALSGWTPDKWSPVAKAIGRMLEAPSVEPARERYGSDDPYEYLAEMGCSSGEIRERAFGDRAPLPALLDSGQSGTVHNHAPELPFATYERTRTAKGCEIIERFEAHAKNGATAGQQLLALIEGTAALEADAEDWETAGDTCDECGQRHYPDDEECSGQDDAVDVSGAAREDLARRRTEGPPQE